MNTERSVIASIVFLGLGLGLIFAYCHDSTVSLGAAYPIAGASLQVVINTNGLPAIAGIISTVLGVLFLFAALVFTVLKMISQRTAGQARQRSFS
jgi:high-affinity nickel permease